MNKALSHIVDLNANAVVVVIDGAPKTIVCATQEQLKQVVNAAKTGDVAFLKGMIDKLSGVQTYVGTENITIKDRKLFYKGQPIEGYCTDKIIEFMTLGINPSGLIKFLEKLLVGNPSKKAVERAYYFLEKRGIPITEEGNFLAYRGLTNDFYSKHSGKIIPLKGKYKETSAGMYAIYNGVGEEIEIERRMVDDEEDHHCAPGIHCGSFEYACNWAGTDGKVVIVEVNPADIVTVPTDCDCQKMRVCKYKVVSECLERIERPSVDVNNIYNEYAEDDDDSDSYRDECDDPDCDYCGYKDCNDDDEDDLTSVDDNDEDSYNSSDVFLKGYKDGVRRCPADVDLLEDTVYIAGYRRGLKE